jgi:hypothetical protein
MKTRGSVFQAECPPSQKDQVEPVDLSVNKSSLGRGEPVLLQVPRYNPLLSVASSGSPPIPNAAPEPSDLKSAEDIKKEQGKSPIIIILPTFNYIYVCMCILIRELLLWLLLPSPACQTCRFAISQISGYRFHRGAQCS